MNPSQLMKPLPNEQPSAAVSRSQQCRSALCGEQVAVFPAPHNEVMMRSNPQDHGEERTEKRNRKKRGREERKRRGGEGGGRRGKRRELLSLQS